MAYENGIANPRPMSKVALADTKSARTPSAAATKKIMMASQSSIAAMNSTGACRREIFQDQWHFLRQVQLERCSAVRKVPLIIEQFSFVERQSKRALRSVYF